MAVKSLSLDLSGKGVITLLLHPGWVQTDMGGASAPIDAATSVAGMRAVIDRADAADTGRFFNYDGNELPW
jgi:NAD(P)-dependent dehydrogenase (short-subunit alcohol dehydrogenase family)